MSLVGRFGRGCDAGTAVLRNMREINAKQRLTLHRRLHDAQASIPSALKHACIS
ncbi:hypothetical protein F444_09122 [Phytophthora nicotianae P1976]|uniref:Uncharacterized protein n=1 Tax=Phytophthora nicotianae P1976 TaxID=1317066 RepID=A0A081A8P3_PHYNI|nr:hypothetical protein F444_09122 [Phytophthora nicotianae P1976]